MQLSDNAKGVALMCGSMFAFTFNDSFMKAATHDIPLYQAIALRGALATLGLLVISVLMTGRVQLAVGGKDRKVLGLRTLAEVGSTLTFLTALTQMPLATLSAIMQAIPLAVTLSAAYWLKEPIGWRRLTAICIGFAGVLLIVKPGTEGFDIWALLGLSSVAMVVVRDLSTRQLSRQMPSVTAAIWASVSVTVMGTAGLLIEGWHPMGMGTALEIFAAAAALIMGYMLAVMVMRVGDIGMVAPFRYTSLLWAILFGWLLFGTLPDGWTVLGAAIVVIMGLYTLLRERNLRRAAASKA